MSNGVLFGEPITNDDKKLNRITTSFSNTEYEIIEKIAKNKNLHLSEVVNLLVKAQIRLLNKQVDLIKANPEVVAFDILTKDK